MVRFHKNINILNSCPTQGRVKGWDTMKPRYYRSVSSKDAGRPRLMHHHKGWWNETKWMRWVWRNGGMKFVVGETGETPRKTYPDPVSSTTKPTLRDRDTNSGPQRWEATLHNLHSTWNRSWNGLEWTRTAFWFMNFWNLSIRPHKCLWIIPVHFNLIIVLIILLANQRYDIIHIDQWHCRTGSDGSMYASGSAGPEFNPGGVVNFNFKIFNLGARRGGDVHFLIARLYITILD